MRSFLELKWNGKTRKIEKIGGLGSGSLRVADMSSREDKAHVMPPVAHVRTTG